MTRFVLVEKAFGHGGGVIEPVVAVRGSYCGVMKAVVMRGLSDSGMVDSSRGSVRSHRNAATGVFPVAVVEKIQWEYC
jgi:hypothetical protein